MDAPNKLAGVRLVFALVAALSFGVVVSPARGEASLAASGFHDQRAEAPGDTEEVHLPIEPILTDPISDSATNPEVDFADGGNRARSP